MDRIILERTFHPMGQGAFYSEIFKIYHELWSHESFCVVYDCGSSGNKTQASKVVKWFEPKEIDILFISHFDEDHVNLISELKKGRRIKKVVIPLLDSDIEYMIAFYKTIGNKNAAKILENPQQFFNQKTEIVYIQPTRSSRDYDKVNKEYIHWESQKSGSNIELDKLWKKFWSYIPYNYDFENRNRELKTLLKNEGIDIHHLPDNPTMKRKIKALYKKVKWNINENSMLVVSTPADTNIKYWKALMPHPRTFESCYFNYNYYYCCYDHYYNIAGCIYTGDANLNKIEEEFYSKMNEINKVGTIQVAHHGSKKDFNIDFFNKLWSPRTVCPISYGLTNSYWHPASNVVNELRSNGHYPVEVTEDGISGLIQIHEWYI